MSDPIPAIVTGEPSVVDDGAKAECDQNSSKLFDKEEFSDLLINFSDRKIHAHRLILCQGCEYFNKLCGPRSQFAESTMKEVTLHVDDPDAVEAMLRHLYNFWLRPPSMSLTIRKKVHFYCNVVVVSDKYGLPALADEARRSLNTFVISIEDPVAVVGCLKIITETYSDYGSLDECAVNLAAPRLADLSTVAEFSGWLGTQQQFSQGIIQDAAKLRSGAMHEFPGYKKMPLYKCARATCARPLFGRENDDAPRCHGMTSEPDGLVYRESS